MDVDPAEHVPVRVRELSTTWWIYLAGDGIDRWVEVVGLVQLTNDAAGKWGLYCAADGEQWTLTALGDQEVPCSASYRPTS